MKPRGFTLIELIIVAAIIGIVSSVILLGNNSFNRSILVSESAHSVASVLRQAQSLSDGFHIDYGASGGPSYLIFKDSNPQSTDCSGDDPQAPDAQFGDCQYQPYYGYDSTETELVKEFHLSEGLSISRICADAYGGPLCTNQSESTPLTSLDIVFSRKDSKATIIAYDEYGNLYWSSSARFYFSASGGVERCVVVSYTGQISTPQTCP